MELTQKVKILPSEEQEEVLTSLSGMCRLLYNFSFAKRIENWRENRCKPKDERKYVTYTDQQNKLPEPIVTILSVKISKALGLAAGGVTI